MSLNLQQSIGGNFCIGSAALTGLSGAVATYTTSAVSSVLRGVQRAKAAVAGGTLSPTTDFVTGLAMTLIANQAAVFVWGLDSGGTVRVIKGATVAWTDTTAGSTEVKMPSLPDTFAPFAYVVIKAGSTVAGTWTHGVSNWNATGIVIDTVVNMFSMPDAAIFTG